MGASPLTVPQFAGVKVAGNTTDTTIVSANTPVKFALFDATTPAAGVSPDHGNDWIYHRQAGTYRLTLSATVNSVAAGGASRMRILIRTSTPTTLAQHHLDVAGGGAESTPVSFSTLADLAAGTKVELWLENLTATDDYRVEDAELTSEWLGDSP